MALRVVLYTLAAILLGAHYLRAGNLALTALCVAMPALFFWKNRWSLIVLQALAYAAAITWATIALQLIQMREQLGLPWKAAALILGGVAAFTLCAGVLLNSGVLRKRYP